MAPKTFAHGWAILAAMDHPGDHGGIVFQWSDDWMLGEELQRLLPLGPIPDQLPELRQPVASVGECRFAGFFELRAGVLLGECQEALYDAVAFYASGNDNSLGPGMCLQADRPYLAEQIGDASFESIDLRGVQVPGIGAEVHLGLETGRGLHRFAAGLNQSSRPTKTGYYRLRPGRQNRRTGRF
jgi:hypothetical protein